MISHRQTEGWRVLGKNHRRWTTLEEHRHQTGQLIYALTGVMLVTTRAGRWTIPPQRALWIPPDHPHSILMISDSQLHTVYFSPHVIAQCHAFTGSGQVHGIRVSPLLRELILGLFEHRREEATCNSIVSLLLRILAESVDLPTHLPLPTDQRLKAATSSILAGMNWELPQQEAADRARMSTRSFARHFSADVGMSYREWRQRARILASLDLLSTGHSTKSVAGKLGYKSVSAFIAAFRTLMEASPGEFVKSNTSSGWRG